MSSRLLPVMLCGALLVASAVPAVANEDSLDAATRRAGPVSPAASGGQSSARFRVQHDGSTDRPLAIGVLRVLEAAWTDYSARLGCHPTRPVTVVLQATSAFRDTTRAPLWAAGWNDGTIRVPVRGLSATTPELVRVLRHELAHSFVAAGAGPRCPIWLHEGVAQWLEGGDPSREDATVAILARRSRLPRLEQLEGPFVALSEEDATAAYAASLSVVAHVVAVHGESGLRRLLASLAEGHPAAEAVSEALAIDYAGLQRGWESRLHRAGGSAASDASAQ